MQSWQEAAQRATDEGFRPGAIAETSDGIIVHLISSPYAVDGSLIILGRTNPRDATTWRACRVDDLEIVSHSPTPGGDANSSSPEPTHES